MYALTGIILRMAGSSSAHALPIGFLSSLRVDNSLILAGWDSLTVEVREQTSVKLKLGVTFISRLLVRVVPAAVPVAKEVGSSPLPCVALEDLFISSTILT